MNQTIKTTSNTVEPQDFKALNLAEADAKDLLVNDGIVIFAKGEDNQGMAIHGSVIRYILENDTIIKGNIVTHETPLELAFDAIHSDHSKVSKSDEEEEQSDAEAMQRYPALVLMQDLQDKEVMIEAFEAAEKGQTVFGLINVNNVKDILPTVLNSFDDSDKTEVAGKFINSVKALVASKEAKKSNSSASTIEKLIITPKLKEDLLAILSSADEKVLISNINFIVDNG